MMKKKVQKNQSAKEDSNQKKTRENRLIEENKGVIVKDPQNQKKFICLLCKDAGSPHYGGLWNNCEPHIASKSHQTLFDAEENEGNNITLSSASIQGFREDYESDFSSNVPILTETIENELDIMYAQFILQYRLPFSIIKPLHKLVTEASEEYDDRILQQYQTSRNNVVKVAQSISSTLKNELFGELRHSPFSLSLDSSSDIHGNCYLAVCCKYLEEGNLKAPSSKLITILPLTTSSTGETIFNLIKEKILFEEALQLNFIGIVTDEGANLTGKEVGVGKRLQDSFTHIVNFKDLSHLFNNFFKKAIKAFPTTIIDIITEISSYFHHSTQRCSMLKEIQIKLQMKPLEILHMVKTRWLSLRASLDRILEVWPALKEYFEEHGNSAQRNYFTVENETSLRILSLLVNSINQYNEFFQKQDLYYNDILNEIKEAFLIFTRAIIKKDTRNIDFNDAISIPFEANKDKDILQGNYSSEVKSLLLSHEEFENSFLKKYDSIKSKVVLMSNEKKKEILDSAIKFLYICLRNMKKKLPYNNEVLELSQVIYFEENDFSIEKWLKLKDLFPNVLRTSQAKDEYVRETEKMEINYKKLRTRYFNPTVDVSYLEVWNHLKSTYPNMNLMARTLLVLPHSSVPVERIFSSMKDIKVPKRSRLTTQNLEACLLGYQHFGTEKLRITDKMMEDYQNSKRNISVGKDSKLSEIQKENGEIFASEEKKSLETQEENQNILNIVLEKPEKKENEEEKNNAVNHGNIPDDDDCIYGEMTVSYARMGNSLKRVQKEKLIPKETKKFKQNQK